MGVSVTAAVVVLLPVMDALGSLPIFVSPLKDIERRHAISVMRLCGSCKANSARCSTISICF